MKRQSSRTAYLFSGLMLLGMLCFWTRPVKAEGSKDLIESSASTDYRPYLNDRNDSTDTGILRSTIFRVYAAQGETINLGSSANGLGPDGNIEYTAPDGSSGTCPTNNGDEGVIESRAEEMNGPNGVDGETNGYNPCVITVQAGQAGVWQIDFNSPDIGSGQSPNEITVGTEWETANPQENNDSYITAWDITVADSNDNSVEGRVFTNYFPLSLGAFGNGVSLGATSYVLTKEGYEYSINLNGMEPFGFIFLANTKGFIDSNGDSLYQSIDSTPNPSQINDLDDFNQTHRLFFNPPDSSLKTFLTIPSSPVPPPTPSNFQFEGEEGTSGQAGTNPLKGNFSFESPRESSYIITLDLNQDGTFGNEGDPQANDEIGKLDDRVLVGTASAGLNTVTWDGLDGKGDPVPASNQPYDARIQLTAGEVHFPFIDVEENDNGLIIIRRNDPIGFTGFPDDILYYDDSPLLPATSGVTPPNPIRSLTGIESDPNGAHEFSGGGSDGWGDQRGIDSWSYYPSSAVELTAEIIIKEADLSIEKTHTPEPAFPGQPITFTLTVTNGGPSDITGATVTDSFPSQLSNIEWSCEIVTGTGTCVDEDGTGDINATLDLENGAVAEYTIKATINSGVSSSFDNTATVQRPDDVNDPDTSNNSDTDTVTFSGDPNIVLVKRITAINGTTQTQEGNDLSVFNDDPNDNRDDYASWPTPKDIYLAGGFNGGEVEPGDEIEYTIYFLSSGGQGARNVTICDLVPENQTYILDSFNAEGGSLGVGIAALIQENPLSNPPVPTDYLTNINGDDQGAFLPAGITPPSDCNLNAGDNTNGLVVVDVVQNSDALPPADNPGNPSESYGFIRFRVEID